MRAITTLCTLLGLALAAQAAGASDTSSCLVRSTAQTTPVVELYTSEGCSSCPPADRWLSQIKPESHTVALAFHVDYWDRLGWKDRFASASYTERQALQQAVNGARFSYTPQVVVSGRDRKDWFDLPAAPSATDLRAATVSLTLARDGERYVATVTPAAGAPARLSAYWAVTELGHTTAVKAGENQGASLRHDHVVRQYLPVAAWRVDAAAPAALAFSPSVATDPAHPRWVNLVVLDAGSGRPVQALKLGC